MTQLKQKIKAILRDLDSFFAKVGSTVVAATRDQGKTERPRDRKRRLYIDATYLYSTHINTGIQRVVRNIIAQLKEHTDNQGIELATVALVNGAILPIDRERLIDFQKRSGLYTVLQRIWRKITLYFASFFRGETVYKDDILLMLDSSWHLHVWPSVAYARQRGAKVIGVVYDLIPVTHPEFCDDVMEYYFTRWYKKSTDYFDGYLAISQTVMHNLEDYFASLQIDTRRYRFDSFPLGADFDRQNRGEEEIRPSLLSLFQKSHSVYLTVATIEPRKNHRYAFEAMQRVWDQGLEPVWLIVGRPGWKTEELQSEMRNHKAYKDKLWIFSDLSDRELHYCYRHAKALVYPSIIEGYGLPIIESLKNELPVLASDTPIHREVGGEQIDYFDLSDPSSLGDLINTIEKGEKSLKRVDPTNVLQTSWSQSAEILLKKIKMMADQTEKTEGKTNEQRK